MPPAADLAPLQLLDGIMLPVDPLYCVARAENGSHVGPGDGLMATA